jgi:hypothetical protein
VVTRAALALAAAAAAAFAGCADLNDLGVCGNGIVEANLGEDCDGGDGCVSCKLVCAGAAEQPDATCPDGFQCGHDNVCRRPSGYFAIPSKHVDVPGNSIDVADVDWDGYGDLIGFGDEGIGVVYGSAELDLGRLDRIPAPPPSRPDSQVAVIVEAPADAPITERFRGAAIPVRTGVAGMVDNDGDVLAIPVPGLFTTVDQIDIQQIEAIEGVVVLAGILTGDTSAVLALLAPSVPPIKPCGATVEALALPLRSADQPPLLDTLAVGPDPGTICVYDAVSIAGAAPPEPAAFAGTAIDMHFAQRGGDLCRDLVLTKAGGVTQVLAALAPGGRCTFGAESAVPDAPADARVLAVGRQDTDTIDDLLLDTGVLRAGGPGALLSLSPGYTAGAIVDVNDDGLGDLVLGADTHPDLEVMIQLSPDVYARDIVRTAQGTAMLRTGDFDGDTFPDVIVVGAPLGMAGAEADLAVMYGGPQGLTDPIAIAKLPTPTFAAASVLTFTENLAALLTVNTEDTEPDAERSFSLFVGETNRSIASVTILNGSPVRTVVRGTRVEGMFPELWELSMVAFDGTPEPPCGAEPCVYGAWLVPGVFATQTGTRASEFLAGWSDQAGSPTPWFAAGTIDGVEAAIGLRRDGYGGGPALWPPELLVLPAPDASGGLEGRTIDLPMDDVAGRIFVGFRAIEVDGDADTELLLVSEQLGIRVPYLVLDPSAGSAPIDLTGGSGDDCLDGAVIAAPDGTPELVLVCERTGGDAGLFVSDFRSSPVRLHRIGQLDQPGGMSAGDVNGDGLTDLVVHNNRIDGRAAGVALQCAHHDTVPCTGAQQAPFAMPAMEAE